MRATEDGEVRLNVLSELGIANHEPDNRSQDRELLRRCLDTAAAGCSIESLLALLLQRGVPPVRARATLAWLLKYDLLRHLVR